MSKAPVDGRLAVIAIEIHCYAEDMEWRYNLLKKPEARLSDHKDEDLIGSWAPSSESFESHYWRYRSYWLRWLFTVIIGGIKRELCIARWEGNVEDVQKIEGEREGGVRGREGEGEGAW